MYKCKHCGKQIFWYEPNYSNDQSRWLHGRNITDWEWTHCGETGSASTVAEPSKEYNIREVLKRIDE